MLDLIATFIDTHLLQMSLGLPCQLFSTGVTERCCPAAQTVDLGF